MVVVFHDADTVQSIVHCHHAVGWNDAHLDLTICLLFNLGFGVFGRFSYCTSSGHSVLDGSSSVDNDMAVPRMEYKSIN